MSHFTLTVIGDYPEVQLDPFQENNGDCKKRYLEFVDTTENVTYKWESDDSIDKSKYSDIDNFAEEYFMHEKVNGKYGYYHNPNGKFDWCTIGGRWGGSLLSKSREHLNSIEFKDLDWKEMLKLSPTFHTYAYLKDGEWHAPGEMGWWGQSTETEEDLDKYIEEYQNMISNLEDDTLIFVFDCHV